MLQLLERLKKKNIEFYEGRDGVVDVLRVGSPPHLACLRCAAFAKQARFVGLRSVKLAIIRFWRVINVIGPQIFCTGRQRAVLEPPIRR